MLKLVRFLLLGAVIPFPAFSIAGERFDGNWQTRLTCPPKGGTEGYTWEFPSVIQNSNFHGSAVSRAKRATACSRARSMTTAPPPCLPAESLLPASTRAESLPTVAPITATTSKPGSMRLKVRDPGAKAWASSVVPAPSSLSKRRPTSRSGNSSRSAVGFRPAVTGSGRPIIRVS